ncbi:MAG: hypothetical protein FWE22_00790 [Firmicutes bacterium]|nr:hypothetical protein [Bacillota bacterium]
MRAFHSFSTKPLLKENYNRKIDEQIDCIITIATLSCLQAKRLGIELVLHTDDLGEKMFGFLPYDNIYATLNKNRGHERFWASGKMLAHEAEPLGSVHFDMDAIIKKPDLVKLLCESKQDLVVEAHEYYPDVYDYPTNKLIEQVSTFPFLDMKKYRKHDALRCGLVKINNQKLKDMYIKGYWNIHDQFVQSNSQSLNDNMFTPDIVVEQSYLLNLVVQHNYSLQVIFGHGFAHGERGGFTAKELGWNHFMSGIKFYLLPRLKEQLKKGKIGYFEKSQQTIKEIIEFVKSKI